MNRCRICGEPAPEGKELCWFCKHKGKLPEVVSSDEEPCTDDACPLDFSEKGEQ